MIRAAMLSVLLRRSDFLIPGLPLMDFGVLLGSSRFYGRLEKIKGMDMRELRGAMMFLVE